MPLNWLKARFCFLWILCLVAWMVSTVAVARVKAIYFVEKNYVDTSTTRFLKKCHLSSRKILDLLSKIVQFSLSKCLTYNKALQSVTFPDNGLHEIYEYDGTSEQKRPTLITDSFSRLNSFNETSKNGKPNIVVIHNYFEIPVLYTIGGLVQLKDSTSYHQTKHRWKWPALFFRVGVSQVVGASALIKCEMVNLLSSSRHDDEMSNVWWKGKAWNLQVLGRGALIYTLHIVCVFCSRMWKKCWNVKMFVVNPQQNADASARVLSRLSSAQL